MVDTASSSEGLMANLATICQPSHANALLESAGNAPQQYYCIFPFQLFAIILQLEICYRVTGNLVLSETLRASGSVGCAG